MFTSIHTWTLKPLPHTTSTAFQMSSEMSSSNSSPVAFVQHLMMFTFCYTIVHMAGWSTLCMVSLVGKEGLGTYLNRKMEKTPTKKSHSLHLVMVSTWHGCCPHGIMVLKTIGGNKMDFHFPANVFRLMLTPLLGVYIPLKINDKCWLTS